MATKTFSYADMPDIDQKRAIGKDGAGLFHPGLPNNGIMYCGPTAGMNVLAFLADHGAADVSPNSKDWTLAANYDLMSSKLNELGGLMGTDANKGTSLGGFQSGMLAWSNNHGTSKHKFGLVSEFPGTDNDWQQPNLGIAAFTEAVGNPVVVSIGYYTPSIVYGPNNSEKIGLRRTGGHFVTMTGFDNSGFNFMDPADAAPAFSQSAYANQIHPVKPVTAMYMDSKGNPYRSDQQTETYLHLDGYGAGDAYIEGYTIIQPTFTLTAKRNTLILRSFNDVVKIRTKIPGLIADAQLSPAGDSAYYAIQGSKTVYKVNLGNLATTTLAKVSAPVTSLAVSLKGDTVYTAAGRELTATSNTGATVAKTTLPSAAAAVAFDPTRGQVDVVTPNTKQLQVLTPSLTTQGTVTLPAASVAKATTVTAAVNATTGQIQISAAGVATTTVTAPTAAQVINPAVTSAVDPATVVQPISSITSAPIVKVTPISSINKVNLPVLLHGAATRSTAGMATAPTTIVRTPQTVLATGPMADQMAG